MLPNVMVVLILSAKGSLIAQNLCHSFLPNIATLAPPSDFVEISSGWVLYPFSDSGPLGTSGESAVSFVKPEMLLQNFEKPPASSDVEVVLNTICLHYHRSSLKIHVSRVPYQISGDGLKTDLKRISSLYRASAGSEAAKDCSPIALALAKILKLEPETVLELIAREVAIHPGCACEIVKSAIIATEADAALVVAIVEAAINASPENARIISQCAIAIAPEALTAVQALLAKLHPDRGNKDSSSKSSKDSRDPIDEQDLKDGKLVKTSFIISDVDLPRMPMNIPAIVFPPAVSEVNP